MNFPTPSSVIFGFLVSAYVNTLMLVGNQKQITSEVMYYNTLSQFNGELHTRRPTGF